MVDQASAIEKMAATVKAPAAARVAGTELWRAGGDRTAAHHLRPHHRHHRGGRR